jgi:hypothetical protein
MLDRSRCRDHRGHHPWRFIGQFADWKIVWRNDLEEDELGLTLHAEKRILMAEGQDQAQRRGTIAHETGHIVRGPFSVCRKLYEESLVERQTARLLMPSVRRIGHALAWHRADYETVADCLWVDERLLNVRLSTLAPRERAWLNEQMDTILL